MKKLRSKLSYANVIASIALFVALGGASYAATQLPKNSVGSKQLKNNAVTGAKIKDGSVTTAKIADGAVSGAKVNAGSLGTVPNATHANSADSAQTAGSASSAKSAQNTAALGGVAADRYVTAQSVLASGETITGVFGGSLSTEDGYIVMPINFIPKAPEELDSDHTIYMTPPGGSDECPGVGEAKPGYLCAYGGGNSISFLGFYKPNSIEAQGATTDGTTLYLFPTNTGAYVRGSWAYTAP